MVEGGGLENRYILTGIEGSNPSLSATVCNQMQDVTEKRASCFFVAGFEPVFHLRASAGGNAEKEDIHPK